MQNEKPAMEVLPERRQIVSSLDQPMSDVYFMEEYGKKARNMGFHSLASTAVPTMRNTLKVVVDRTTVLRRVTMSCSSAGNQGTGTAHSTAEPTHSRC